MFPPDVPTKSSYSKKSFDLPTSEDPYGLPPSYVGSEQGTRGSGRPGHGVSLLGVLGALALLGLLSGSNPDHRAVQKTQPLPAPVKPAAISAASFSSAFWFAMGMGLAAVLVLLVMLLAAMASDGGGPPPPSAAPVRMDRPGRVEGPPSGWFGSPRSRRPRCVFV